MPKATSVRARRRTTGTTHPKRQHLATVSETLWQTIFGGTPPSTLLGQQIVCDVAAARLDAAGLLIPDPDLARPRETP